MNVIRAKMSRLWYWVQRLLRWIWEGRIGISCVLVLLISGWISVSASESEASFRMTGSALQVLGVIVTIRGLMKLRLHFEQPKLSTLIVQWWNRFPKKNKHALGGSTATVIIGSECEGSVWSPDNPELPVEDRLERIVKNLLRLKDKSSQNASSIKTLRRSVESHAKNLNSRIDRTDAAFKKELENLHTSDILISLVGLIWVAAGLVMSTLSVELHSWLN